MTGKFVSGPTAKAMRADRAAGMKLVRIAEKYGVSVSTVSRHTSAHAADKLRQWDRARYARVKADPEKLAEYKARKKSYMRDYQRQNSR